MLALLKYNLLSLWVRRTTTLATTGGIALVVFVLGASQMLSTGMRQTISSAGNADQGIVLDKDAWTEATSRMDHAAAGLVAAAPGVKRDAQGQAMVTEEAVAHLMLRSAIDPTRISTLQVRGIGANVFALRPEVRIIEGRPIQPGTDEALVGKAVLGRYPGLRMGERVDFSFSTKPIVVGVFEAAGSIYESEIWADFETVRRSFSFLANVSSITAQLESAGDLDGFSAPLGADQQVGLSVASESAYYKKVSQGLPDVIGVLGIVETLIFSLGAVLGALITMHASVSQRSREIGVLRALGFGRGHILFSFVVESAALGFGGALVGAALALLTTLIEFRCANFATGQEVAFRFAPSVTNLALAILAGTAVGAIGGLVPAIRAARVSPVEAMRA
ncbi:MAG TPA: ABC transporter permease [Polyangiaceae bacterium]|nr:ABC transporter permease [Polyangiaceae bacterium]